VVSASGRAAGRNPGHAHADPDAGIARRRPPHRAVHGRHPSAQQHSCSRPDRAGSPAPRRERSCGYVPLRRRSEDSRARSDRGRRRALVAHTRSQHSPRCCGMWVGSRRRSPRRNRAQAGRSRSRSSSCCSHRLGRAGRRFPLGDREADRAPPGAHRSAVDEGRTRDPGWEPEHVTLRRDGLGAVGLGHG
jgi:hypothetical protein